MVLFGCLCTANAANTKTQPTNQSATVIIVQEEDSHSPYIGEIPVTPLQSPTHWYDVWLRLKCVTYGARYHCRSDPPDPMFAPNRVIEMSPQKHVLNASGPGGKEFRMSIVRRSYRTLSAIRVDRVTNKKRRFENYCALQNSPCIVNSWMQGEIFPRKRS
jgi:hypothetical protein